MSSLDEVERICAAEEYIKKMRQAGDGEINLIAVVEHLCTPRQVEVMQLFEVGLRMADIARRLKLTPGRIWQLRNDIADHVKRARRMINRVYEDH